MGTDRRTLARWLAVGTAGVGSGAAAAAGQPGAIAAVAAGSIGAGRRPAGDVVAPGFFVFVAGRIDR